MQFETVVQVGVGGTGSHLLEPLARLMAYHPSQADLKTFFVIDGDVYEEKNQERQLFDKALVGQNKAVAAVNRINFSKVAPIAIDGFINKIDFVNIILGGIVDVKKKNILIILAVDNDATRRDIILAVDEAKLENFVVISPGNDYSNGQVIVYAKQNDKALTSHPFNNYSQYAKPQDRIPGGCAAAAPSTPQLITANMGAAWGTLLIISALLDDKYFFEELRFDCETMKLKPLLDPVKGHIKETKEESPLTALEEAVSEKPIIEDGVMATTVKLESSTTETSEISQQTAKPESEQKTVAEPAPTS